MSKVAIIVCFVAIGIVLGGIIEWILQKVSLPIPYTVIVFYIGIVVALVFKVCGTSTGQYIDDSTVSSDIMLYGLVPTLLFSETMHINLLHFRKSFAQSSLLAGPGGVIVTCLLTISSYMFLPFNWSWNYYFLFGAVLSSTDPVSLVSLLKHSKASSSLSTIISGETMLNDGSAMILYLFFYHMINGTVYNAGTLTVLLAKMLLLSPLIGCVIGLFCFWLSRRTSRPTDLHIDYQIMFTFLAAYASFYVADVLLDASGVLACCAAGVTVALLVNPSIIEHEKMHEVWHMAQWTCNTLIYLLGGFIGGQHTYANFSLLNVSLLVVMYFFLVVTRAVMVAVLYPIISNIGMKMTAAEAVFVAFAGLRGALAIALALDAARNADDQGESDVGSQFFFIITGLVSMTLLVNATVAGKLLVKLRLVEDPDAPMSIQKAMVLLRVKRYLKLMVQKEMESVQNELGGYDAEEVARLCKLQHSEYGDFTWRATVDEYAARLSARGLGGLESRSSLGSRNSGVRNSEQSSMKDGRILSKSRDLEGGSVDDIHEALNEELVVFARQVLLDVVRAKYMDSVHTGKIGSSVMASKILLFSVDTAQDHIHDALLDWTTIEAALTPGSSLIYTLHILDEFILRIFSVHAGLVGLLDAFNERNALYVLINYIDAHEYALDKLQFILGYDTADANNSNNNISGAGNAGHQVYDRNHSHSASRELRQSVAALSSSYASSANFSRMEAHQVILETVASLDKARHLLTLIDPEHLKTVYTHRAARIVLIKQEEILLRMMKEGTLSDSLAHSLFSAISEESDQINLERASHDRTLIRETRVRKIEEEKQMRESMQGGLSASAPSNLSFSLNHPSNLSTIPASAASAGAVGTGTGTTAAMGRGAGAEGVHAGQYVREDSVNSTTAALSGLEGRASLGPESLSLSGRPSYSATTRTSLRAHLTGDDSLRASFNTGRPRPMTTIPSAPAGNSSIAGAALNATFSEANNDAGTAVVNNPLQ